MGYGSYSHEAHVAMTSARSSLPRQEVFKQREVHPTMAPKGIRARECRDSATHPQSLAIAFALDVTGSMGAIPDLLAREKLPTFMALMEKFGVPSPQLLFLAVGDANSDRGPMQVGQFEATGELMDQWLTRTWLEGGGGAFGQESYELALYFMAEHTAIDCFEKRNQRGYLFLTGDEHPYPTVARAHIEGIFGDQADEDIPTEAVVASLQEQWKPFFLIPDRRRAGHCEAVWRALLGDHVIVMEDPADTCHVAAAIVALGEGRLASIDMLASRLRVEGLSGDRVGAVIRAVTPYAATLRKDAAPPPSPAAPSAAEEPGLFKRLFG